MAGEMGVEMHRIRRHIMVLVERLDDTHTTTGHDWGRSTGRQA